MFKPKNYSAQHIRRWAYKKHTSESAPDWNDVLTKLSNANVLIDIALDPKCPRRAEILNYLYKLSGTIVSRHEEADVQKLHELVNSVQSSDLIILNWVNRSKGILQDLRKYDYAEWCEGGFVSRDLPHA